MEGHSVLSALANAELSAAASLGLDRDALIRDAGFDARALADPDARVPLAAVYRMWELLSAHRPPIGLELGARVGLAGAGIVGYAMQHGATVQDALTWLGSFRSVIHPDVVPATWLRGEHVVFSRQVAPAFTKLREPVEAQAAATVSVMRALTGKPLEAAFVALPLARPADPSRQERWFECPVAWGSPELEIGFDAAILEWRLPRSDPQLFGYLARRAEALLAALPAEASWSAKAQREIGALLAHGEPRLADIAKRLGTSGRTLHRRLDAEGTKLSTLVDEARRERALLLAEDRTLSVGELAFLLGYSEPAAFIRAFKRWTGETPTSYRERLPTATEAGRSATSPIK